MSLRTYGVGLVVLVLFVYLDYHSCELLDKTGPLIVTESSDKIRPVTYVVDNRTMKYDTALGFRQKREGSVNSVKGSSKRKKKKDQKGFMEKMLPMMVIPFLVSSSMIPMLLISLKIMMLKSAIIGKIAILLVLFNMFRRRNNGEGGVFNHNINADEMAMEHYGYKGGEEYGAYVNRRKRGATFGRIRPT